MNSSHYIALQQEKSHVQRGVAAKDLVATSRRVIRGYTLPISVGEDKGFKELVRYCHLEYVMKLRATVAKHVEKYFELQV